MKSVSRFLLIAIASASYLMPFDAPNAQMIGRCRQYDVSSNGVSHDIRYYLLRNGGEYLYDCDGKYFGISPASRKGSTCQFKMWQFADGFSHAPASDRVSAAPITYMKHSLLPCDPPSVADYAATMNVSVEEFELIQTQWRDAATSAKAFRKKFLPWHPLSRAEAKLSDEISRGNGMRFRIFRVSAKQGVLGLGSFVIQVQESDRIDMFYSIDAQEWPGKHIVFSHVDAGII